MSTQAHIIMGRSAQVIYHLCVGSPWALTLKGGFFLETSIHKDPSSKQNFHAWYRSYNAPQNWAGSTSYQSQSSIRTITSVKTTRPLYDKNLAKVFSPHPRWAGDDCVLGLEVM